MLDTIDNFQAYFERIIDLKYVFLNRFYVDLRKEICASVSLPPMHEEPSNDEAQLYDDLPSKGGQTFYNASMLRDACNLTSFTPKRSRLREGGLVYNQFYNSVKEMIDAAKSFPFQNEGLEELALDPQIRQSAHVAGGNADAVISASSRRLILPANAAPISLLPTLVKSHLVSVKSTACLGHFCWHFDAALSARRRTGWRSSWLIAQATSGPFAPPCIPTFSGEI
jgi:hypothetical protein